MSTETIKKALAAAEQFIVNGVELGYIRMPNPETPDSAHDTLPMIRHAQTALESLQRENERLERERAKQWRRARRADASRDTYSALAKTFESEANQLREVSIANRHRAEAAEAEVKLIREAASELLNQAEHVCLGAHTPLNIKEAARNLADPIAKVQTALASTGGQS